MKLDGFVKNNQSLVCEDFSLKLKSFIGMKKATNLKSFLMVFGMLFFAFFADAQNNEQVVSKETIETTTVLLKELERKVQNHAVLQKEASELNLSPEVREKRYKATKDSREDIFIYIGNSLEDRCTIENRLKEIAIIVKPFDLKLSEKFEILDKENQQNKKNKL